MKNLAYTYQEAGKLDLALQLFEETLWMMLWLRFFASRCRATGRRLAEMTTGLEVHCGLQLRDHRNKGLHGAGVNQVIDRATERVISRRYYLKVQADDSARKTQCASAYPIGLGGRIDPMGRAAARSTK